MVMGGKSLKRIFGAMFLLVAFWGATQLLSLDSIKVADAKVLVSHKEMSDKKFNMKILIPQIEGSEYKENQALYNKMLKDYVDFRIELYKEYFPAIEEVDMSASASFTSGYALKYNSANLISISFTGDQYTGGAHGIYWRNSLTMDLSTGKLYSLFDLFKEESGFKEFIDARIKEKIIEKYADDAELIDFEGVNENTEFYITNEVVAIYYQPYEIAAYVMGMPTYYISCEELDSYFTDEVSVKLFRE